MINSRKKGHSFELRIIDQLKELGYEAVSSRSESRNMDDKGVDIIDTTPFYIQCKKTERTPDMNKVLKAMPDDPNNINIVVHSKNNKEVLVTMTWEKFKKINL